MTAVIEERMSSSPSLVPSRLILRVPIDINYRCSAQRSDPHLQQMERISDISERNRPRSGAIISSRLTSLSVFSFFLGEEELSHIENGRKTVSPLFSLHPPRPASLSLFLSLVSLRRSRVFSRLAGTIYHSVS